MNGRLSGPVNMILPNHVYLGTFYDSLVSINILMKFVWTGIHWFGWK